MAGGVLSWPQTCPKNAAHARSYPSRLPLHFLSKNSHNPNLFPKTPLTPEELLRSVSFLITISHAVHPLYYFILALVFTVYMFVLILLTLYGARFTATTVPVSKPAPLPAAFEGIED